MSERCTQAIVIIIVSRFLSLSLSLHPSSYPSFLLMSPAPSFPLALSVPSIGLSLLLFFIAHAAAAAAAVPFRNA